MVMAACSRYLISAVTIVLLTVGRTSAAADLSTLTCYTNDVAGTPGNVSLRPAAMSDGDTVCFKAPLKHPAPTGSWVYGVANNATCDAVPQINESALAGMICCATPGCNAPDSKLDKTTRVNNGVRLSHRSSVLPAVTLLLAAAFVALQ